MLTFSRRRLKKTLAVSTVISTMLMTTVSITLGIMVLYWSSQTFSNYQGSAGIYFNSRASALRETFVVEDVWFYLSGSTKYMNITVRNTGTIDIKIVAIYVDGISSYAACVSACPMSPPLSSGYQIPVGQAVTFRVTYTGSKSFQTTNSYFLQVATLRGNQVSAYWSYP